MRYPTADSNPGGLVHYLTFQLGVGWTLLRQDQHGDTYSQFTEPTLEQALTRASFELGGREPRLRLELV